MISDDSRSKRHIAAYVSPFTINYLHQINPWIPTWWSAAFPGFGQIMMSKYLVGSFLIGWEVFFNQMANVNTAIYYTMLGEFEKATAVIDLEWFYIYIPVYIYGIWDSYRRAIKYNKDYILSYEAGYQVRSSNINGLELNRLEKRKPLLSLIWSSFTPGIGYLYINRLYSMFLFTIWFVVIIYLSNLLPAIHYTMLGDFEHAKNLLDPQWYLYFPSLYAFTIYDSYVQTVEYNKIFNKEQSEFFKREYQQKDFIMPIK